MDLNPHKCNFETRREIYERVQKTTLVDLALSKEKIQHGEEATHALNLPKNEEHKKENSFSFGVLAGLKWGGEMNRNFKEKSKDNSLVDFKPMKSILGHISKIDENNISPVAIYCICFSSDSSLFFTGDNNGLIKIWSTMTGALVDIFKSHEKAINETIIVDDYLISCSDDMSVKVWDIKTFTLIKSLAFEDSILSVIHYNYSDKLKTYKIIIASSASGKLFLFDLAAVIDSERSAQSKQEYEVDSLVSKVFFDKKIQEKFNLKKSKALQQTCMAAHPTHGVLVCGFNDGYICVWDIQKILHQSFTQRKFLYEFDKFVLSMGCMHSSVVQIAEFNRRGDHFITASVDGLVLVWKVLDEVLTKMRNNEKLPEDSHPIYSIFKMQEGENRIRCSVNASTWTSANNYVVALISSKNRKRGNNDKEKEKENTSTNRNNFNNPHINADNLINPSFSANNLVSNAPNTNIDLNTSMLPNNASITQPNNINNSQIPLDSPSHHFNKRSSALLVYDINTNSVIRRLDEQVDSNLSFHDECYVLESHPKIEEIVLTVTNLNEIVLIDFLKGRIVQKFVEENFFFSNVSHAMVASEGKFSAKGDSFVISTYFGSVSIYNIYSKASFSGTYMNQFFTEEFSENENDNQNINALDNLVYDSTYRNYVNMYDLPYISAQPLSEYKIKSLEENVIPKLTKKYSLSIKDIHHKLKNNFECYESNLEERQFECAREENIFKLAVKENLNLAVSDNLLLDEGESDEAQSDYVNEAAEFDDFNLDEDEEILEEESNLSNADEIGSENYNMRLRRSVNRTSRRPIRTRTLNRTTESVSRARMNLRSRRSTDNNNNNININDNSVNNIANGNPARRRLRLHNRSSTRQRNNINLNSSIEELDSEKENSELEEEDSSFAKKKKQPKKRMINDEESELISIPINNNVDNNNSSQVLEFKNYGKKINNLISACENIEELCYLCNHQSKQLIGPFITDNNLDFSLRLENTTDEDVSMENRHNFYFHVNCLLNYNDFVVLENRYEHPNLAKTIKNTITQAKMCFRCNMPNATKKCVNCDNYFHGQVCLAKFCLDLEGRVLCFNCLREEKKEECLKFNNPNYINNLKQKFGEISRENYNVDKFSYYTFFPQIGEKIYFIVRAYEDFLSWNIDNILLEPFNSSGNIFFWKDNDITFNYYQPFLCEIKNLEFAFPSDETLFLLKKNKKRKFNFDSLKIISKITLECQAKTFDVLFFSNQLPDFMINAKLYEQNFPKYQQLINTVTSSSNFNIGFKIVLSDQNYEVKLLKLENRETSEIFKDSLFENLMVEYLYKDENSDGEAQFSFWDIYNSEIINTPYDEKMKIWCENLYYKLEDIVNKNKDKFHFFLNRVDEVKDFATDYYKLIPVPMWINLIKTRLINYYYVSEESFIFDLELIMKNACRFNDDKSTISKYSRDLVREVKKAIHLINGTMINTSEIFDSKISNASVENNKINKRLRRSNNIIDIEEPQNNNIRVRKVVNYSETTNLGKRCLPKVNYDEETKDDFMLEVTDEIHNSSHDEEEILDFTNRKSEEKKSKEIAESPNERFSRRKRGRTNYNEEEEVVDLETQLGNQRSKRRRTDITIK